MKTKEEIAALIEDIFKNAERIHGNSEALDWIKVASSETVENLWYEDIIRLDNADQCQSEIIPSDEEIKNYWNQKSATCNNCKHYTGIECRILQKDVDYTHSCNCFEYKVIYNRLDEYFKSQLKPAEKEEKNTYNTLLSASKAMLDNIEKWLDTGESSDSETSKMLYKNLKKAVTDAQRVV